MSIDDSRLEAWRAMQRQHGRENVEPELPLKGGGGGGIYDGVIPVKEYVDARDEAVESRLNSKLDKLPSSKEAWGMVRAVLGGVLGIVVAALAFIAFAGDRFDAGLAVSPQMDAMNASYAKVNARQDEQINAMDAKLDVIINQTSKH
jgi:hypothetical protein